jgi:hypothetical protein
MLKYNLRSVVKKKVTRRATRMVVTSLERLCYRILAQKVQETFSQPRVTGNWSYAFSETRLE